MCVALSFLFGYLLSTRCVYPQLGRTFEAPIGHKTLLCDHMLLLAPFIAYFLKKNYSLRQNTLKNLRVWERSLTSIPIGVYLGLIEVGTWLGTGSTKELWRFAGKEWPNAAPDSEVQRPVTSQEVNRCYEGVTRCWNSSFPASGQMAFLHPVKRRRWRQVGPNSGYVRSVVVGRVRSQLERFWTSLESNRL